MGATESVRPESGRSVHKVVGTVVQAAAAPVSPNGMPVEPAEGEEVISTETLFAYVKGVATKFAVERVVAALEASGDAKCCAARDASGHSLAHWAAKRGDALLLQYLLKKGAPKAGPSDDAVGMQPLHWACTEGRLACMRLLVEEGVEVDARDFQGCTPLLIASQWGQPDAVAYLVKIGANVKIFDRNDDSALHWASYKGNLEIVGLLHHLGLPLDDRDAYGQTPLHLAAMRGNLGVCEYLLTDAVRGRAELKLRLGATDRGDKTAEQLASDKGHGRVARFLKDQQPLCEQGVWTFVTEHLTLGSCVHWVSGGSNPEAMKWPWFIMVFNKLLAHATYFVYFLATYREELDAIVGEQPLVSGLARAVVVKDNVPPLVHAMNLNTQILVWVAFLACWRGDPGVVDGTSMHGALRRAYDSYFDRLVSGTELAPAPGCPAPPRVTQLCHSCHIQKPLRSKHCKVRRKCVLLFDHFCPYVGNTVGMYNYRFFYLYCAAFTASAVQWQVLAVMYHRRVGHIDKTLLAAQLWFGPFILFGCAMVAYHTQLVVQNLSTNEHINMGRYEYFRDGESGEVRNPFDHGVLNNVIERFFPKPIHQHPLILQITKNVDGPTRRHHNPTK
ncbi:ankyrin repeat-containing domain protein [Pelagophyceae sp. CCMP2097]|nr:ankyrin repeat-containing domain protein [Pelagophyceae sp. CCMP2097]